MPLSRDEQHALDVIESHVRAKDPAFAALLTDQPPGKHRRMLFAHGCLWLGLILTLWGFGLAHEAGVVGVLLIANGAAVLTVALASMLRLHAQEVRHRLRSLR